MRDLRVSLLSMVVACSASLPTVADTLSVVLNDTVADDAFLYNGQPDTNFGGSGIFYYDNRGANNDTSRSVFKFDLVDLPVGAVVNSVSLTWTVYQYTFIDTNNGSATVAHDFSLHQVLTDWVESEATWNSASSGVSWAGAGLAEGLDYDSAVVDTISISSADTGMPVSWDITSLYNAWVNGTAENYGVTILGPDGVAGYTATEGDTTDGVARFYNTEYASDALRPKLTIDYTVVPEPASALLLIAGASLLVSRRRAAC